MAGEIVHLVQDGKSHRVESLTDMIQNEVTLAWGPCYGKAIVAFQRGNIEAHPGMEVSDALELGLQVSDSGSEIGRWMIGHDADS
jgi:hypothetical protein